MTYPDDFINKVICGDAYIVLKDMPDKIVDCCVTSPPYWGLRDYGVDGQLGLEKTPGLYVRKLVKIFREVRRALKDGGTLWLNLGDSYYNYRGETDYQSKQTCSSNDCHKMNRPSGKRNHKQDNLKGKDLVGIPWMVAFALRADGWYLRQDIIWHKPNPMPESVKDRCTKSHEYIFLFSKSPKYYYDNDAIVEIATGYDGRKDDYFKGSDKYQESTHTFHASGHNRWKYKNLQDNGQQPNTIHLKRLSGQGDEQYPVRNKRSVWTVNTEAYSDAHFAVYPTKLITPCILAGCPTNGIVLDPFFGSGTTGLVAKRHGRKYIGIELNKEYEPIQNRRLAQGELFA